MKGMHETDGPKNYFQSYHHYQSNNNNNHHQNYNNQNSNYNNSGYQHFNNGSYNSGYYNSSYRNNYSTNRRFFRNSNKYFHNNPNGNYHTHHSHNQHHHQQYNNTQHHDSLSITTATTTSDNNINTNISKTSIVLPNTRTVATLIRKPPPTQHGGTENENCSAHNTTYRPTQQTSPLLPESPCSQLDNSSISSRKIDSSKSSTCSSSNESEEQTQPNITITNHSTKSNTSNSDTTSTNIVATTPLTISIMPPPDLYSGARDLLSDAILAKFIMNTQTEEIYRKKMNLWKELYELFKPRHNGMRGFSLQIVGSTMSGFGSRTSDVDICLMIRRSEVDQRIEAVDRLHELQVALQKLSYMDSIELIYAKVPILKFHDSLRNLDVDLNCNNSVGIRNTHLLYCYSTLDPRVKPLVLITKLWAQFHGINDAKNMTISSYSLVLMVIHYLQFACKEPVLPCLHQMFPIKFGPNLDVDKIKINEPLDVYWKSQNADSLGDLLIGFLEYYSRKFDYSRAAVSVRLGCHLPIKICMQARSFKNDPHQWKYLCVEEPFDLTNTARSVYDKDAFDRIRGVFCASWQRLQYTRNLDAIFYTITENEARAIAARLPAVILR